MSPAFRPKPAFENGADRWVAAEWVLLLLLAAGVLSWLFVPDNAPGQHDFRDFFYPAARLVAQGQSPYGLIVYPPHFALMLGPLGLLPYHVAATLWQLINLSLLAITLRISEQLVGLNPGWRRRTIVYLALLLWAPAYFHFSLGACSLIVAASLCGALFANQRDRQWLAGLLLAVSAIKPQLVFLLGAGLVLRAWREHGWLPTRLPQPGRLRS